MTIHIYFSVSLLRYNQKNTNCILDKVHCNIFQVWWGLCLHAPRILDIGPDPGYGYFLNKHFSSHYDTYGVCCQLYCLVERCSLLCDSVFFTAFANYFILNS